jgi:hypothetical protein
LVIFEKTDRIFKPCSDLSSPVLSALGFQHRFHRYFLLSAAGQIFRWSMYLPLSRVTNRFLSLIFHPCCRLALTSSAATGFRLAGFIFLPGAARFGRELRLL